MGERIWLKNYAEGVPAEVDVNAYPSISHLFQATVNRYRALPAFTNMGTTITYGELERMSRDFAGYLQKDLGMVKGERLAIMLPNVLQYPVVLFGAFLAGLTVVNVNPLYTARELEHQLSDSGTRSIVVLENFAHTVQEVMDKCALQSVITTKLGDLLSPPMSYITNFVLKYIKHMVPEWTISQAIAFADVLSKSRSQDLDDVALTPEDIAFLQYTGGTTGVPKGAMLSHGNIVAVLQQGTAWFRAVVKDGEEIAVTPLPVYHIYALVMNLLGNLNFGGHNILITNPRDMHGFIKELKKSKFTSISGVNTLYNALLNEPTFKEVDVSHVKIPGAGGAAVQRAVAEHMPSSSCRRSLVPHRGHHPSPTPKVGNLTGRDPPMSVKAAFAGQHRTQDGWMILVRLATDELEPPLPEFRIFVSDKAVRDLRAAAEGVALPDHTFAYIAAKITFNSFASGLLAASDHIA